MIVILMGVSGSGKSTIGSLIANQIEADFIEGDDYHPNVNIEKIQDGIPLNDDDRKPWLEKLAAVIESHRLAGRHVVVACSALKASYRDLLIGGRNDARIVYLKGSERIIRRRLELRKGHFANPAILISQLKELEEPREAITVDIEETPEIIVATICAKLIN
jgi:gluconokinase